MRKLELFLVPPTCAETRETVRTEPQPSESECSDDALSSKRDSVGGGAAEQARRARAPTVPGVFVSGPYGLSEARWSIRSPGGPVSRLRPTRAVRTDRGMRAMFAGYS